MKTPALLLYILLIGNTVIRYFTNHLQVLPRVFNVLDVFVVIILFLIFLSAVFQKNKPLKYVSILKRLMYFDLILIIGALLNSSFIYLPAFLSQIMMYNEPVLLFISLTNIEINRSEINRFKRILTRLIYFELILGLLQFPIFLLTKRSESIMGTFQHNAEQYAAFMMIALFYMIAKQHINRSKSKKYITLSLLIIGLVLCIDNKASWLGSIVAVFYILITKASMYTKSGALVGAFLVFLCFLIFGWMVIQTSSGTLSKFTRILDAKESNELQNLGKVKAYHDIWRAYCENPHMAIVGAGPSTFYSRASRQFFFKFRYNEEMYAHPFEMKSTRRSRASDSMGGVLKPTSMEPYYKKFYVDRKIYPIGTAQVDSPFSTYAGLLGETGLVGTLLYISIYFTMLKQLTKLMKYNKKNTSDFPFVVCSAGFMIYLAVNSIYGPSLETGRMTTILWSIVAVVCISHRQHMREISMAS